ncbi:MAG: cytochrome c biogenesis heme-transporting ATPase CcmA [Burkholderiales bacterium]|nr:cytochrome c biogenesis heme-transporting ATPase CcmA [Burkholderiales bacterium]
MGPIRGRRPRRKRNPLLTEVSTQEGGRTGAAAPAVTGAILELRGLACRRGRKRLFGDLDAQLAGGELLRITGANGAGKTSLLKLICGLLAPEAGQVLWRGEPIGGQREAYHRELVHLGHAAALKDELSALENLRVAACVAGQRLGSADARRALAEAGLAGREQLPARLLSQGQRRRAVLARLAFADAALWVLDEPFNALDTAATGWLLGLLRAQLERGGMVVLTSHLPLALDGALRQRSLAL